MILMKQRTRGPTLQAGANMHQRFKAMARISSATETGLRSYQVPDIWDCEVVHNAYTITSNQ